MDALPKNFGFKVVDARSILNDLKRDKIRDKLPSIYSDRFRLEALRRNVGTWIDLDVVLLKPLPNLDYLYGWERHDTISNAILRLPSDSLILAEYLEAVRRNPTLMAADCRPLKKRLGRRIQTFIRPLVGQLAPLPDTGPVLLTHLLKKHCLEGRAQPIDVFYPIRPDPRHMHRITDTAFVREHITANTIGVHLWRYLFRMTAGNKQPISGWLCGDSRAKLAAEAGRLRTVRA